MIKNERQYQITKYHADKFAAAIARLEAGEEQDPRIHPRLRQAEIDGMKSIVEELHEEMAEYEALKAGRRRAFRLHSLEELPQALIKARIAAGLTQKELAQRLGLKEQQIQRYESNDYAGANLHRLNAVLQALNARCDGLSLKLTGYKNLPPSAWTWR